MSALVPRGSGSAQSGVRTAQIAQVIRATDDVLLRPWRVAAALLAKHPRWSSLPTEREDRNKRIDEIRRPDRRGAEARSRLADTLARLPPTEELREFHAALAPLCAEPDHNQSRLLIALMVDRHPNLRAHEPATYVEGLVFQAERAGCATAIVAKACDGLLEGQRFLPTPAEFSEALKAAEHIPPGRRWAEEAIAYREAAEADLTEAKRLGLIDLTEEWKEVVGYFVDRGWWSRHHHGPAPGQEGCVVPANVLAMFDLSETKGAA